MNESLFSSKKHDYETPEHFFNQLNSIFKFKIDLAADHENRKVEKYLSIKDNSLEDPWLFKGWGWLNPPYGRDLKKWFAKASVSKSKIIILSPARTDTSYFHDYIVSADCLLFIRGRLVFDGCASSAPFPSLLSFFGKLTRNEFDKLSKLNLGYLIDNKNDL